MVVLSAPPVIELTGSGLAGDGYFFVIDVGCGSTTYGTFEENLQLIDGLCTTDASLDDIRFERFYLSAVVHDFLHDLGLDHIAIIGDRIVDGE